MSDNTSSPVGFLALTYSGKSLHLQVLKSAAGFYIGTADEDGPCSRESTEYFETREAALEALASENWTQRRSV